MMDDVPSGVSKNVIMIMMIQFNNCPSVTVTGTSTGDSARRYPTSARRLLGVHGLSHRIRGRYTGSPAEYCHVSLSCSAGRGWTAGCNSPAGEYGTGLVWGQSTFARVAGGVGLTMRAPRVDSLFGYRTTWNIIRRLLSTFTKLITSGYIS